MKIFFHACLISLISCRHITRLSHDSVRLMNEWQSFHNSQYKVGCQNFHQLWLLKHWKIHTTYRQWYSNFSRRGRKLIYEKENRKLCIQWLWWWHFLWLRAKINNWKICHRLISATDQWRTLLELQLRIAELETNALDKHISKKWAKLWNQKVFLLGHPSPKRAIIISIQTRVSNQLAHRPIFPLTNWPTDQLAHTPTGPHTNFPTHQLAHTPTFPWTNSPTDQLAYRSTCPQINWPTDQLAHRPTGPQTNWPTDQLAHRPTPPKINLPTDQLAYKPTCSQTKWPTNQLAHTNLPTHKITSISWLQN